VEGKQSRNRKRRRHFQDARTKLPTADLKYEPGNTTRSDRHRIACPRFGVELPAGGRKKVLEYREDHKKEKNPTRTSSCVTAKKREKTSTRKGKKKKEGKRKEEVKTCAFSTATKRKDGWGSFPFAKSGHTSLQKDQVQKSQPEEGRKPVLLSRCKNFRYGAGSGVGGSWGPALRERTIYPQRGSA